MADKLDPIVEFREDHRKVLSEQVLPTEAG